MKKLWRGQRGASLTEYGFLAGLVAVVAIGAVSASGGRVRDLFGTTSVQVAAVGNSDHNRLPGVPQIPVDPEDPRDPCSTQDKIYHNLSGTQVILDKNVWAPLNNGTEENPEFVCIASSGALPTSTAPWSWKWNIPGGGGDVVAYPNVTIGQKPWNGHTSAPAAGSITGRDVDLAYSYSAIDVVGRYNMAASTWLLSGTEATPSAIAGEVMIWVENNGVIPAGGIIASGVSIGGVAYDLWHEPNMADRSGATGGWPYFAFVAQGTHRSGTLGFRDFMDYLVAGGHVSADLNLSSIEFGTEIIEGSGEIRILRASVAGLAGVADNHDWAPISPFSFPTTIVPATGAPARIGSEYLDIVGLGGVPRSFTVTASSPSADARAISNVVGGSPAASGELQYGTALDVATPAPGESVVVTLEIEGVRGDWTVTRESEQASPVQPFGFGTTTVPLNHAGRISSPYLDIVGLEGDPLNFSVTAASGNPMAISNVVGGGNAASGQLQWGTALDVDAPAPGESIIVTLEVGGVRGTWTVTREAEPVSAVQPFNFGTTTIPASRDGWVQSDYLDIIGLEGTPLTFTVTADAGSAVAVSNVVGGGNAASGQLQWGTALGMNAPAKGTSVTVTLTVDGISGTWTVVREADAAAGTFALTMNNGINYAQIMYDQIGVPQSNYSFTLSGTGNTAPVVQPEFLHSGSNTNGTTVPWGIGITSQTPPAGVTETITLIINGQQLQWQVTGP